MHFARMPMEHPLSLLDPVGRFVCSSLCHSSWVLLDVSFTSFSLTINIMWYVLYITGGPTHENGLSHYSDHYPKPFLMILPYGVLIAIVMLSLFCVACTDPGLMERVVDEEAGEGGWFWNEQVGSFRPPGALYCRECGVLIQDYDHLCPWTGTGIGRKNMWAFKTFAVSVNVLCYFSIGLVVWALLDGIAS